ncbi:MAG: SDR family NAD(P)-dependent oxidoreductase [Magnetovibrionaceae bacterium]
MTEPSKRLDGRLALITGASRGIGRAVALAYAAEGAHVIALARTKGALEELDDEIQELGGEATLVPADLMDPMNIDRIGGALYERFGKLDILVGNAGVLGTMGPITHIEPKSWDMTVGINLTANWRLIRSMDPLLRQSDAGRAIFVSSGAANGPRPFWGGYAVSKVALEMLAKTYALENAKTKIRVNLIDPGATRTGMRADAYPGEDPMTLKTPEALAELFIELASPACNAQGELFKPDV